MQQTDKCNAEYEVQLDAKHEKLIHQLKYVETLQQNIIELNRQLENNGNEGNNEVGTFGILRQNTNYRSLPLGSKLRSLTDDTSEQHGSRTDPQHCRDTLEFDISTYKDETKSRKSTLNPSSGNNINLSATTVSDVGSSSTFTSAVNSDRWSLQTVDSISHSENLRNTSYRMIGRFAVQQGDTHQSAASYIPASADCKPSVLRSGHRSSDVSRSLSFAAESLCVKPPVTITEPHKVEHTLLSKGTVYSSLQPGIDDIVPDVSSPFRSMPLSVNTDGNGERVVLPDVVGLLSDNVTQLNVTEYDKVSFSGSADTAPTLSVPSASKVPPSVAQKPKCRHPCSASKVVTSCDSVAVSAQPNVITATPYGSVDVLNTSTTYSVRQDCPPKTSQLQNMLDEPPLSKSGDLSQKITVYDDDGQDLTDSSRLVSRLTYKPSVIYPVRRRQSSVGEGCAFSSTHSSGDSQSKKDMVSVAEDSSVCSEGTVSRVQKFHVIKNKLRPGMSRRVQFEPFALLLDAALEGEIDLLQTTLKV